MTDHPDDQAPDEGPSPDLADDALDQVAGGEEEEYDPYPA